jgi:serine/threonine protein kinase
VNDSFLGDAARAAPILAGAWALRPGDTLKERYVIDANLASGGQAIVYRATDTVLSRPVIVKVMRGSGANTGPLKSRFEGEMRALSHIDHPGVVGIFDVGELPDGRPFLVIQYVNGVSLREELQDGPLAPARTARLLRQLASALGAAHAAGIAHRDVKPENIMVQRSDDRNETVKLIDFGISDAGPQAGLTSVVVAGTIRYMAPEQFNGESSTASDVYALAIVACEMLCGHPDSRALPPAVDAGVKQLIDAALSFRPEDRPRDIGEWSDELASALVSKRRSPVVTRARIGAALAAAAVIAGVWTARTLRYAASSGANAQSVSTPETLEGDWTVTGILTVCGFLCGSPVGTVYHSTATFSHDTPTTFHGTYFDHPIRGTVSGNEISFAFDNLHVQSLTNRGDCVGTIAGPVMTLKCSEYLKPGSGQDFLLNGSRTDTVAKQTRVADR